MIEWTYKAKDRKGKITSGSIFAERKEDVDRQIKGMNLKPVEITEFRETFFSQFYQVDKKGNIIITLGGNKPSMQDIMVFTKQFSIMVERGVPIIQSLAILSAQGKNMKLNQTLEKISMQVENGATLSQAMSLYKDCFDNLYISMIRAGELSGNLDKVLREVVKFLEKAIKLKRQIKSASVYPAIVSFVAATITYAIIAFMVPVFAEQYMSSGKPLPYITQIVVDLSNFLSSSVHYLIMGIVAVVIAFKKYRDTPQGAEAIDDLLLKLPMTGELLRKIAVGRFSSTMSTMMSSGVSILEALTICGASSGNKIIEKFVSNLKDKISQGSNFSGPLAEGGIFPPMVVSMVAVGEQTGALDETLAKVAEIYEEEVDIAVADFMGMIQPILIVLIGTVLGFVVIALYLPIFDQASMG